MTGDPHPRDYTSRHFGCIPQRHQKDDSHTGSMWIIIRYMPGINCAAVATVACSGVCNSSSLADGGRLDRGEVLALLYSLAFFGCTVAT